MKIDWYKIYTASLFAMGIISLIIGIKIYLGIL